MTKIFFYLRGCGGICCYFNTFRTGWILLNNFSLLIRSYVCLDEAEEELKHMEEFRKAQEKIEKKNERPISQKMG